MNQPRIFEQELTYTAGYQKGQYDLAQSITNFLNDCQGLSYKERLEVIAKSMIDIRKESEKHVC